MLKFTGNNTASRPVLGIGLTRENCDRLLGGQPIVLTTENMLGLPPLDVCLFAGETDEAMANAMVGMGAVTAEQIREDRSLANPHVRQVGSKEVN